MGPLNRLGPLDVELKESGVRHEERPGPGPSVGDLFKASGSSGLGGLDHIKTLNRDINHFEGPRSPVSFFYVL